MHKTNKYIRFLFININFMRIRERLFLPILQEKQNQLSNALSFENSFPLVSENF